MTASEFITFVEAKLNRLDSSAYQDVRPEEVLLYANDALKALTLNFDVGIYSRSLDRSAILNYLAGLTVGVKDLSLTTNTVALPVLLKIKDLSVFVTIGEETGWMPTRDLDNIKTFDRDDNPFLHSYPDTPGYRLIDGKITFVVSNFACTKINFDYLKFPDEIVEGSTLNYIFMKELIDHTTTLLLETLESRRIQSQPAVSKA